jgi:hypothetical protein
MKRQILLLVAMAVFATAFTTNASGQTGKIVRVNVKFDFQIGDRSYPAGEYWIESIGRQPDNILQIRSVAGTKENHFIVANPSTTAQTQAPKLVFEKYGENYFLRNIVLESGQWGYSIRPSRSQRESGKDLAARIPRNN